MDPEEKHDDRPTPWADLLDEFSERTKGIIPVHVCLNLAKTTCDALIALTKSDRERALLTSISGAIGDLMTDCDGIKALLDGRDAIEASDREELEAAIDMLTGST